MRKTSKAVLMVLIAISFVSTSAFAESPIEISLSSENIKALDTILITGKITGLSEYKPLKITVIDPDGIVVYSPTAVIENNGEFKRLLQPTIPSFKAGTYTVTASHEETEIIAQAQFTVTSQEMPRNQLEQSIQESVINEEGITAVQRGITLSADAVNGSDVINIVGNTTFGDSDITLVVSSPTGNIVTFAQVTPETQGSFEVEIKTGGAMWKEDGAYTITANQGTISEHKESIIVEIKDGVVVPEFGVIASLVLAVAVLAIVAFSAKSRLSILPKY